MDFDDILAREEESAQVKVEQMDVYSDEMRQLAAAIAAAVHVDFESETAPTDL